MAHSNKETIEIREREVYDGRKPLKIFELYIDNCKQAAVEQQRNGSVKFRFNPKGAFDWQEAQVWIQGLLDLSMIAEELNNDKKKITYKASWYVVIITAVHVFELLLMIRLLFLSQ